MSYHAYAKTAPQAALSALSDVEKGALVPALKLTAAAVAVLWILHELISGRRGNPGNRWIKGAIKKPGALRAWVQRKYGSAGFDSQGRIKMSVLNANRHAPGTLGKRVRLAITMRDWH